MLAPRLSLDREYSLFGRVVSGMEYVDAIQRGEPPPNPSRIVRASIGSDNVPPMSVADLRAAAARPAAVAAAAKPTPPPLPPSHTAPPETPAPTPGAPQRKG